MACRVQSKIVLITVCIHLLCFSACKKSDYTTDFFYYKTDSLKSGDIILRKSYGLVSDIIVRQLNDTVDISHCGILIKNGNNFIVIHSLDKSVSDADGIQSCSLEYFWVDSRPETVKVMRFNKDTSNRIAKMAEYYLKKKVKFDKEINLNDTNAFYCSELPYHIINKEFNIKIASSDKLLKFSAFFNREYFSEIRFVYKK